ncbi:L-serine ammonia-lyase, iron-sulfur-dependent, subunit alpha [Pseudovibrio sp. Tun.PSC04-5.I4]|uniref:L-cysteine desulfidase family protein n=1 Tax=Pseudovibrio sp. Tun.PSC04-5.I4 TaxID=1798213 RepID=UPI000891D99B|nr:L-serine ammonia-lyase, iron-sulfur-dependent, subunit alpha [Pseudovibrio sp. Tun.PSC04-5.I4]SDQ13978.1 L-cysteine desulfidase [Pseudovibrio sp. Tun.PSC04-5.I4]
MTQDTSKYLRFLRAIAKPALGCTDPICAAYAAAEAAAMLNDKPTKVEIIASKNLFKNALDVFVPGTNAVGMPIAAACGALFGKEKLKLQCLQGIRKGEVDAAHDFIKQGRVTIKTKEDCGPIYCHATLRSETQVAEVLLEGGYTQVTSKKLDGVETWEKPSDDSVTTSGEKIDPSEFSIASIYEFCTTCEFDQLSFILEARDLNKALSEEGLRTDYGLQVGKSMLEHSVSEITALPLCTKIPMRSAAASDARMGGSSLPAMSNYGSGNQGIAATMPVVALAEHLQATEEQLARALCISHIGAGYIKSHYPLLSAYCGNSATCAAGASALVYLMGGSFEQSCYAINLVLADLSGMLCDGAKASCALKVASAATSAHKAANIAMKSNTSINMGVVADEVETTIRNLGNIVTTGMAPIDDTIFSIMADR